MPCVLRISEAASLGMHSMGLMATDPGRSVSTREIATTFNVSEAHLSKVLQRLVKVGLLSSVRGPRGGFSLAKPSDQITLIAVYEALEGPVEPAGCLFSVALCDGRTCILGDALVNANDILRERMMRTTLADTGAIFQGKGVVPGQPREPYTPPPA